MPALKRMGPEGDVEVATWDVVDEATKIVAKEKFGELSEQGYVGFEVEGPGQGTMLDKKAGFEPSTKDVIMMRPLAGG